MVKVFDAMVCVVIIFLFYTLKANKLGVSEKKEVERSSKDY